MFTLRARAGTEGGAVSPRSDVGWSSAWRGRARRRPCRHRVAREGKRIKKYVFDKEFEVADIKRVDNRAKRAMLTVGSVRTAVGALDDMDKHAPKDILLVNCSTRAEYPRQHSNDTVEVPQEHGRGKIDGIRPRDRLGCGERAARLCARARRGRRRRG